MSERISLEREGTRLSAVDFGGEGPPVLLLHGLAGHAEEWADTARAIAQAHRVLALDARGHGHSERRPAEVSRDAHVADTAFLIETLDLGAVALVGQSLGGHTALLTAAARPELVASLVVVEATPLSGTAAELEREVSAVVGSLRRWPVPFPSAEAASAFWDGPSVKAHAWVSGLEQRADGLWPRFDVEVMDRTLRQAIDRPRWREWESLRMPTLLVRGSEGPIPPGLLAEMAEWVPGCRLLEIPGAGHDPHLEAPEAWSAALIDFLAAT